LSAEADRRTPALIVIAGEASSAPTAALVEIAPEYAAVSPRPPDRDWPVGEGRTRHARLLAPTVISADARARRPAADQTRFQLE
jgi:hypothetical protein